VPYIPHTADDVRAMLERIGVRSIEDLFDESSAPGLGESVDYLRTIGFLEVDYREPVNARKGGWYRVDLSRLDDRTSGRFTFNRLDTDLRQFVGFLAGRRVIATRLFVSTSDTESGQVMPFYLMPTLGGNSTLRGFREYRHGFHEGYERAYRGDRDGYRDR